MFLDENRDKQHIGTIDSTCHIWSHTYRCACCRITLEIMTLQPRCEDVETAEGVAITVTGVAQVTSTFPHPVPHS